MTATVNQWHQTAGRDFLLPQRTVVGTSNVIAKRKKPSKAHPKMSRRSKVGFQGTVAILYTYMKYLQMMVEKCVEIRTVRSLSSDTSPLDNMFDSEQLPANQVHSDLPGLSKYWNLFAKSTCTAKRSDGCSEIFLRVIESTLSPIHSVDLSSRRGQQYWLFQHCRSPSPRLQSGEMS